MQLITIDNGNSHPHVGLFENNELKEVFPLSEFSFNSYNDNASILSSVGPLKRIPFGWQERSIRPSSFFKSGSFFDMPVHYSQTLGEDRLSESYFIFKKIISPDECFLLLDAGTFLTADFISSKGFLGGYIFPGEQNFLNSYFEGSYQLPQLTIRDIKTENLPQNTEEAILKSLPIYFKSIYRNLIEKHEISNIVLTGGSSHKHRTYLEEISYKINLTEDKNLIHHALHFIYQKSINQF